MDVHRDWIRRIFWLNVLFLDRANTQHLPQGRRRLSGRGLRRCGICALPTLAWVCGAGRGVSHKENSGALPLRCFLSICIPDVGDALPSFLRRHCPEQFQDLAIQIFVLGGVLGCVFFHGFLHFLRTLVLCVHYTSGTSVLSSAWETFVSLFFA